MNLCNFKKNFKIHSTSIQKTFRKIDLSPGQLVYFLKSIFIILFAGSRPESSEDDHPQYQNGNPPLLLDPMAIHMMPPEYDRPVHKKTTSMIEKVTNGLSKLHFTNGNIKGSLV